MTAVSPVQAIKLIRTIVSMGINCSLITCELRVWPSKDMAIWSKGVTKEREH